ncbi:EAL domain-containing protein [Neptunomonas marina]|nr:EAL domain-containing protein [Neptunomonas marina]
MEGQLSVSRVPVIAIGASAGGLEAVSELLSYIAPDISYAIVVLQHLSPDHRSMMPELLDRATDLDVVPLKSQTRPEAGCVYVVPAGKNAYVEDDYMMLSDAPPEIAPKPSINAFFSSLARFYSQDAIGVILSGTGTDGTEGLQAIQARGGITITQTLESAKYDGMPKSALDAGVSDYSLSPKEIANKLTALSSEQDQDPEIPTSILEEIVALLQRQGQVDFSGYKLGTLSRRICRRMASTDCEQMDRYLALLKSSSEEVDLLAKDILISVTAFFRDQDAFSSLRKLIIEQSKVLGNDDEYRVWVAGCATGEEAYSVAILILEALRDADKRCQVQVFATDIDEQALLVARQGMYSEASLKTVSQELIDRYFIYRGDGKYEAGKTLRDIIIFARHNLISDPPFLRLNLVTCRNVLIYLDNKTQSRVLQRFNFALNDDGGLFLGRSESIAQAESLFNYVDRRERIFQKTGGGRPGFNKSLKARLGEVSVQRRESPQLLVNAVTDALTATAALCTVDGKVLQTSGKVELFFQFPVGSSDTVLIDVITPVFKSDVMSMLHLLKKSGEPQKSRPMLFADKTWQVLLSYTKVSGENRVLLLIMPHEQVTVAKPDAHVSQYYTDELQVTQEQLQSLIEELATANEEMQSLNEEAQASNEELQATNEELEAANEELQSTNEELVSVNDELSTKTQQLSTLNAEYIHLYDSLDFPVLVFDESLHLVRFNSAATFAFNLRPNALNTSLERIHFPTYLSDVAGLLALALNQCEKQEQLVENNERFYQIVVNPGLDDQGSTKFVVLNLIDVTDIHTTRHELDETETRLQTVMDNTTVLIAMKDLRGRYIYVNEAFMTGYGLTDSDYHMKSDFDLFPDEFAAQLWASDLRAIRTLGRVESELSLLVGEEMRHYSTRHIMLRDHAGQPSILIVESEDVTARKKAEEKLKIAAKVYQQAGEAIVVTDKNAHILSVNEAFTDITGYNEEEALGKRIGSLLNSGRHSKDFFLTLWQAINEKGHWQGEIWNKRKNGDIYPEWLTINRILNEVDDTDYFIAVFSDISNLKDSQRKVEFLATHDALTGLPNRNLFSDRLENAIARSKRSGSILAVLYLDLDNFKSINDTLGHDTGDELLVEVSQLLLSTVRDVDTVSRLGGDEFTVILGECEPADARDVAERIITALDNPIQLGNRRVFTSTSIGISLFPSDATDANGLLKSADTAMYKAKETGRNRYCFFHSEMRDVLLRQSTLESSLKEAIRHRQFRLVYQPKFSALDEGKIVGAEALLRWHDPSVGDISPAEFVPIAERGSAIIELSNVALEMLAEQIARWLNTGVHVPKISFNVSAQCLKMEGYANELTSMIDQYMVPYELFKLELTESSLMDSSSITFDNLNRLTESGFEISIDDFGTGYSSLSYLKQLPLSEIKIDKSFVDGLGSDEDDEAICQAILSIAQALGLSVVAEGVENAVQQAWLKEKGCDYLQGYLLAKPLENHDFEKLLVLRN